MVMFIGRPSTKRQAQEICFFCALRAKKAPRSSRRLHSSSKAFSEGAVAQRKDDSDNANSYKSRYSHVGDANEPSAEGSDELFTSRYINRQTPSWKARFAPRPPKPVPQPVKELPIQSLQSSKPQNTSNEVQSQRQNERVHAQRLRKISMPFNDNAEQDPRPGPVRRAFLRSPIVTGDKVQNQGTAQPDAPQRSPARYGSLHRSVDLNLFRNREAETNKSVEYRRSTDPDSEGSQKFLRRRVPNEAGPGSTRHEFGPAENDLHSSVPSLHEISSGSETTWSAGAPKWTNLRRKPAVSAANDTEKNTQDILVQPQSLSSNGADENASSAAEISQQSHDGIGRFKPLSPSRSQSPRHKPVSPQKRSDLISKSSKDTIRFGSTPKTASDINPINTQDQLHVIEERFGDHLAAKTATPSRYSAPNSSRSIPDAPDTTSAPERFRQGRRASFWEEDDVKSKKISKSKSYKSARSRNEDEDDGLDGEKLEKIEFRQRKKAERKADREERASGQVFVVPSFISIGNLASSLRIRADAFSKVLQAQGFSKLSNDHILDAETAGLIAAELGFKAVLPAKVSEVDLVAQPLPTETDLLPSRPPIVTIMGHVDHGKTTLLDWLRNSSIAASEHGGITQHIGAFTVQMPSGRVITFLDTPGHAAFLEMRARGANVTDIVILVVAADDSVMPQTIEAIKHAKAARTHVVVAISKIDKPEADPERVKQDLARHGIEVEDYGGETQTVCVSGKTGQGMDQLEDAVIALADILDVKADITGNVEGWVLEAARKASGKIATVLVRRGTLKQGQIIVAGNTWARVRNLRNETGSIIDEALPGTPVEVDGWDQQPEAGAEVLQAPNEQKARRVVDYRLGKAQIEKQTADVAIVNEARKVHEEKRAQEKARAVAIARGETVAEEESIVKGSGLTEIPFIIRADVSGSIEAVNATVLALGNSEVRATVIRGTVGKVSESDIEHAAAVGGHIVNFNTTVDGEILRLAEQSGVRIIDGSIIYRVTDDVKALLEEHLSPLITHHVIGEAEILQLFDINLKGKKTLSVAGCKVRNGTILKGSKVKVLRGEKMVYDGILTTLKNVKKDVTEMRKGTECGISFDDFPGFAVGDHVQCYETKSEKRRL